MIAITSIATSCYAQSTLPAETTSQQAPPKYGSSWYISNFISVADAEKILKQPVYVKDSLWKYSNYNYSYLRYKFTYNTNAIDSVKKTRGSLFFSLEEFQQLHLTKKTFADIKALNEKSSKYSILNDLGDESFLARDELNHPFIVVRKGNRIYKLRMLYATGQDSEDEFMLLAKKIVANH